MIREESMTGIFWRKLKTQLMHPGNLIGLPVVLSRRNGDIEKTLLSWFQDKTFN